MKEIWKSFTDLFKGITDFLKNLLNLLLPPKFWHWQTFLLLSGMLLLVSIAVSEIDSNREVEVDFISVLSWLFLTFAVGWLTTQKPFVFRGISLSPWITAGLICFLLYEKLEINLKYVAIISWPIIAVCIAAIILVLNTPEESTEQKVDVLSKPSFVILVLVNFLVSCWLGLYFVIQGIVQQYPTMGEDDLSKSTFVYRLIKPSINDYRGAKILNLMQEKLNNQLATQRVELSVPNMKLKLQNIKDEVTKEISEVKEDDFWKLQTPIVANQSGYQLELQLFWEGITAKDEGYYLSKNCKIEEKVGQRSYGNTSQNEAVPIRVGNVECSAVEKKLVKPENQSEDVTKI
ncbi:MULTISPECIES: DUF5357 family protein [Okeania]|uniref:DUF5357 domain-containing protein n=1 Tax=Okeania hirsuta TaxID=1458930 RepID=A0A3N6NRN9_9CYAN|nr:MULTISPECIES: DUF5357 family protein [Okeania]NES79486.1 DUF5357 domain-containing protein [Okeania sp. SIO1H4]NET23138.1 DUF5357 domain-containing protein [Okeania sp. SIO1H5]NET75869.1 DUF5357 domain-containing protein [Okeania sp. SIO1F9]NET96636.1 DUF5357 domain-containing protein [Okeania sp. SIO1H2]RQH12192.1 hypothetical protein D4Z78_26145 [Okeania hirsuta]